MSVIDCGVSISDEQLKHIAICQTDKTTFLQMIGRKRVNEGMRVTLYICNQPPTKMNSRKNLCIRKLRLLIGIYLLNEHENKQTGTPTKYHDGLTEVSILTDNPKNAVVQAIAHGKAEHLIYSQGEQLQLGRKHYQDEKPSDLLKEFRYSKTAFLALAYQLQNYAAAVEECRVDYRKTYLKRQLSWIDREYDESLWVTYQSTRDELVKFLDEYVVDNKVLWKSDQMAFRKKCHKLFLKFPDKPDYCHKMYGEAPPSKMRLNEAFIEKKIPFTIVAKQSSSAGRKTYWKITRT